MHIWNNAMFQQIKSSFTKSGQVKNDTNQSFYLNAVTSNIENELKTSNPSSNLPWRTNLNIWFPSTIWSILPGECILPGMENTGDCQGEIYNSGKKTLYFKSFADREGQCYYQDVFAVLNL